MAGIVTLKKGEGRTLKSGGFWGYDNEIASIMGSIADGDITEVRDFDGYFLGRGYYNSHSKIRIRLLSRTREEEIDDAFFERRVRAAWNYRKQIIDTGSCRVIFSEADGLPGIVVDKFSDVLVAESETLGIDRHKDTILRLLKQVLSEDGIDHLLEDGADWLSRVEKR